MSKTRSLGIQVQGNKSTAVQTKRLSKEGRLEARIKTALTVKFVSTILGLYQHNINRNMSGMRASAGRLY